MNARDSNSTQDVISMLTEATQDGRLAWEAVDVALYPDSDRFVAGPAFEGSIGDLRLLLHRATGSVQADGGRRAALRRALDETSGAVSGVSTLRKALNESSCSTPDASAPWNVQRELDADPQDHRRDIRVVLAYAFGSGEWYRETDPPAALRALWKAVETSAGDI